MIKPFAFALLLAFAIHADARADAPAQACEREFDAATEAYGLPQGLLHAIATVESGRHGRPFAWAVGERGQGFYPATREEAAAEARRRLAQGRTNLDLGCLQINWRWHGAHFPDPDWALEPRNNVHYAAWLLARLRRETGSWAHAVARFHASDALRPTQTRYVCRVLAALRSPLDECQDPSR